MAATGKPRDGAKKEVNRLAYSRNTLAIVEKWSTPAQAALRDYALKLHAYKATLQSEALKNRGVTTMSGRFIAAEKGKRLHAGRAFNWRIQGTIADVVNQSCLRLAEVASLVLPVHDAIYAILPNDKENLVANFLREEGRKIGLTLSIKVEIHH